MQNLIQDLFKFILQRARAVSDGIRRLFMPDCFLGKVKIALKRCLERVLHIKPRDEKDYYSVGRYLVSRRLISMIIFVMGIAGTYYLMTFHSPFSKSGSDGVKVYNYDSIRLRYAEGTVKIKAKSGYIAYYGEVSKGKADGNGTLYRKSGTVKYSGMFKDNKYNGNGILYGENGNISYQGEFKDNIFEGNGKLYYGNGSVEYEGEFHDGEKSGNGRLYDSSNNLVYEGSFIAGNVNYNELLGKSTGEISQIYTGKRTIYYDNENFVVDMEDIDAVYAGNSDENYLDDSVQIQSVFVKKESCIINGKEVSDIMEVKEIMGEPGFEGNSYITMQEAVAMQAELETASVFEDALEVQDYQKDIKLYLTMFEYEQVQYTFYSTDRTGKFIMYSIEK